MEYLEGWELVPGHDDGGREKLSSTKHGGADSQSESEEVLCPSPSPPVSPRLDTGIPTEKNKEENPTPTIIIAEAMESEDPPVPVSPISLKETEFVDMKLLESKSKAFDHEDEEEEEDQVVNKDDFEESDGGCAGVGGGGEGGFDLRKWGWGLTGIGALCSFGVATMFVLVLGAASGTGTGTGPGIQTKNNMGFNKGYEENQRLKEMVSAVRGGSVPLTRAHITFGGYYDAPSLNH